ncbi:MAG: hypothetical protein QOH06_2656 [Acidobacteriota bacterium]|jgi:EmrB/QacA subfamily drug resistance transporter|nr:hypothetical protein [Acidobacteriota bacterium]
MDAAPPPTANLRTIFAGLMLGMFLAAMNQTIIAPAMPRIVAELGGMAHYSWIAVSALLASTVIVPIVGKLSDLYGRKAFYVGGILVFMASSLVAGLATGFGMFMVARVLEGFGMGTMMPLSQAILGDLIPPRERGKYQGLMGGVFGLASVIGPFLGGFITDGLGWRWLFFLNLPLSFVALGFIIPFMKLPHVRRPHRIDYAGFATLTAGLTTILLATVWGGTELPWSSPVILGLYAVGAVSLLLFVRIEGRAAEPVLPLRLWKNGIFTSAVVASMCVAMGMFGAIYFIPMFVQGVLGKSVTGSGAVLTPMMLSIVAVSALSGYVISRTGRYKPPVLLGLTVLAVGLWLLTRMDRSTPYSVVIRNMVVLGAGLGTSMQTFVLIVQNAVGREDLGVATAATQLFRSIGSTVGIAILGTVLAHGMERELPHFLPPAVSAGELGAGALLDPHVLAGLSPGVAEGLREALAAALHPVFMATLPFAALALVAAVLMREVPLRRSAQGAPAEAGKEILAEMAQAGEDDHEPVLGELSPSYRSRVAFLGLLYGLLADHAERDGHPRVRDLLQRIGEGDASRGQGRLEALSCALLEDCDGQRRLEALDPKAEFEKALSETPPRLREHVRALITHEAAGPTAVLTPGDLDALERIGIVMGAALLLDLSPAASPGSPE